MKNRLQIRSLTLLVSALTLAACLAAPQEPESADQGLSCTPSEQAFNGGCKKVCATNDQCPVGLDCMSVGAASLCLDYKNCAYLGSDSACNYTGGASGTASYEYGYGYGYGYGGSYGYGDGCVGDAKWVVSAASGNPACGQAHAVVRCTTTPNGCELVSGSTNDVAEP